MPTSADPNALCRNHKLVPAFDSATIPLGRNLSVSDFTTREKRPPLIVRFGRALGPGLTTGASDDDPSGIATYSQAGAEFGYSMLWTMLLSYPLMTAIQEISARI